MTLDLDALEKVAQEAKSRNDQSFGLDDFGDLLIGAGAVLALIAELKDHRRTIRIWKVGEREAHLEAERDALQAKLDSVTALHQPFTHPQYPGEKVYCEGCAVAGRGEKLWPCPTIQAIGETGE